MGDAINTVLENLGEKTQAYQLAEAIAEDTELEVKFLALESLSELERPKTVRALREILRIFVD